MGELQRDAILALTTLGFTKTEARRAVDAAIVNAPMTLEQLLRAALQKCPKPGG